MELFAQTLIALLAVKNLKARTLQWKLFIHLQQNEVLHLEHYFSNLMVVLVDQIEFDSSH